MKIWSNERWCCYIGRYTKIRLGWIGLELYFGSIHPAYNNNSRNEKRTGWVLYPMPPLMLAGGTFNCLGKVKREDAGEFDFEAYRRSLTK